MEKKKVLIVFGTRPEAIKMAPLVLALRRESGRFETKVCVTAQHREMLDQVLRIFSIVPDIDLNLMEEGQDLTRITVRVLEGMKTVLEAEHPDIVLVHGDTTTSAAAALAAFYQQIPVGHVEAGLRTYNIYSPWPEEMNRQITGRIARWHFAPTANARENLLHEGVNPESIEVTGNTVIDALHLVMQRFQNDPALSEQLFQELCSLGLPADKLKLWNGNTSQRRMVLITGHRRENFGEGFQSICLAIRDLAVMHPSVDFVYPMHMNPNVRKPIRQMFGEGNTLKNIYFIEPLQYLSFVKLMNQCALVLTDSGGIQEEAPGLGKPVLVMRTSTERPEAVTAGTVRLTGTDHDLIVSGVTELLTQEVVYRKMAMAVNPYGDGHACERILQKLVSHFE